MGTISPVLRIQDAFEGSQPIVWADNTDGTGFITATDIMNQFSKNFTSKQRNALKEVENTDQVRSTCILNFSGASGCFSTITFDTIPTASLNDSRPVAYTVRYDNGAEVQNVDVTKLNNVFETKLLAVQWALDQASVSLDYLTCI